MDANLLDIQPPELKFVFELKKKSSCTIQLVNKSHHHVAYKVKTTTPTKYYVQPYTGIIMPKSTCEFTVMMQAQQSAPTDLVCQDKFLVQSTPVPPGTKDEDITSDLFSKEDGNYIEETRLNVVLTSPQKMPSLINGILKQKSTRVAPPKNHFVAKDSFHSVKFGNGVDEDVEKDESVKSAKGDESVKSAKGTVAAEELDYIIKTDMEPLCLTRDIAEIKSKLGDLMSKLSQTESTISKLTRERQMLREELEHLKNRKEPARIQPGFHLLCVAIVGLISIMSHAWLLHVFLNKSCFA